jgi:hypothetical protein
MTCVRRSRPNQVSPAKFASDGDKKEFAAGESTMHLHVCVGLPRRDLTPRPQATIEKGRLSPNTPTTRGNPMARVRCITEMGMGVDVHGRDATKAAKRAVSDAILPKFDKMPPM